ncbi:MAG TPA: ABC transporter substrate binding protein [Vicinamibacteria bacterium]|nr:ABC transporter substrate binding protein [Vicinamibacteria bacterium]
MRRLAKWGWMVALAALAPVRPVAAAEVAVVKSSDVPAWRPAIDALRRISASHTINEYDLRNDRPTADSVLAGLKGKAAIIVALGPLAAQLVRSTLPDAPLVFAMVQEPAKLGLAPGPGVTGVAFAIPIKNQLAAFRLVHPKGVRIGVIYKEDNSGHAVEEAIKAATLLRVVMITRAVTSERDIPAALRSLLAGDQAIDALWIPPDPVLLGEDTRRFLQAEMFKAGKAVYGSSSALVAEGALVSNGPDLVSIGEQVGELVNRLAAGDRSRIELLVPRAELVINKKIAARLKIEVSAEVLKAANKVF